MAQTKAQAVLKESRQGIDETEASVATKLSRIRSDIARGLSPEQIAHIRKDELNLSRSTIYRWIEAGYANMTNLDLRRKVGYKPRKRSGTRKPTRHERRRSYDSFLLLGEDMCASSWEMDTVLGSKQDEVCLLTLLHRPSRFQLVLPLRTCTTHEVVRALKLVKDVLGACGMREVFQCVLTDNGHEFSDEKALAEVFGERESETRLYYCDARASQQKGACEKNHVEIRKLLPKGQGIRFDELKRADCALVMSHINSEPRGSLGWITPIKALLAAFGALAQKLLDAFGVLELSTDELDLTRNCIERERKKRGEAPLS